MAEAISRAQLLGGVIATGSLAACGAGTSAVVPLPASCAPAFVGGSDRFSINEIFANSVFDRLDKQSLLEVFDPSPAIDAHHQAYLAQSGQRPQNAKVIAQIPPEGIVINAPGTYTFAGTLAWNPNDVTSSAITIACSDVTVDMAGFALQASVSDTSQAIAGILIAGPVANVTIANGTVASVTEYGILARNVCGLAISRVNVTGISMQNLAVRLLTPAGIQVSWCENVTLSNCSVTGLNVTTDSCAGIQLIGTSQATVSGCLASSLVNNDGAVQGFSYLGCTNVATSGCTAQTLQSHFNGNVLTSGHTVLGFCPIFCFNLSYADCTAAGLTGCCDDCHGMSVFLDAQVTVARFHANQVVDGVSPSNSGAKATGLEVYGASVTVTDSTATNIRAINPQDKQAAGFSAWGVALQFERCSASNVTVQNDAGGCLGIGFGWAPDPRTYFRTIGAYFVAYTDCSADGCDAGFDTWFHVDSTWTRPVTTNCATAILVQPGATRTVTGDPCSECSPPITATLTNFASGNTYPP